MTRWRNGKTDDPARKGHKLRQVGKSSQLVSLVNGVFVFDDDDVYVGLFGASVANFESRGSNLSCSCEKNDELM